MQPDLSHLEKAPFSLDREELEWVANTFASLSEADRVGQVFNMLSRGEEPNERALFQRVRPGGITRYFSNDGAAEKTRIAQLQADAAVPLLVSCDLEGSRMSLPFGTQVPNPIALAAIDDLAITEEVSRIMAREALATGVNWSFTPVLDINAKTRSSIVATRGFGNDPEVIARHALAQIRVFQEAGLAATAKHWPGEGHDARDQHLVTTINPLSKDEWEKTHGRLYRAAVNSGVLAVMSAHIALPSYAGSMGATGVDLYRPASLSSLLNVELLRKEIGFNGLIVSDASEMGGLSSFMPITDGKVEILRAGNDMILFSNDPDRHFSAVLEAVRSGKISAARFSDAVTRVLALKAKLGLHRRLPLPPMPERRDDFMRPILRRAPVLEKDVRDLLPISVERYKRVLVVAPGIVEPLWGTTLPVNFPQLLEREGFEVTVHTLGSQLPTGDHDLVIYVFSEETLLTRGRIFLDWAKLGGGMRGAMQRIWQQLPTIMISFGYPYYLYDAPRVPTYINAWATMDEMQEAVVDLLLGRAEWNRKSPIDAFDGAPDGRY
ncbi:glycoside hydrolase family 3 N-terminal domain-containing protein [Rhizobium sp. CSW-27]|uniref:glycoside hydrolase family 3 protein n=1 Tax=Rhizobium sp. CSW-27 TaxID=2839985 RepID=UPI001C02F5A6|nr:glycoside hydrolase family 3 N-terminal domain-containing protein [Rhizobium sp. CSW-27]MBT9373230.1 glycoside hydrolase family 3 protein [Rhizobium sp. CSW-27]